MARREYKGAAVQTRLSTSIGTGDTSFDINAVAGWPTGGANGSFTVILNPGESTEEHILVGSRSANTLSGITRGYDDTVAAIHSAGADGTVILGSVAVDFNEANRHINDITLDEHTQYMRANGTRHDLTARHPAGTVIPTATPVAIGTALAEGAGTNLARSTHVHTIGAGAINSSGMFGAGVVDAAAIGADAVGTSELGPLAVTSAEIADDAIISRTIGDDQILAAHIADGAIDATPKLADAIVSMAKFASEASVSYDPDFAGNGWTVGTGGVTYGRYYKFGRLVFGIAGIALGTGGNLTGQARFELPFTSVDRASGIDNHGWVVAGRASQGGVTYSGLGVVADSDGLARAFVTAGTGAAWDDTTPFNWASTGILQAFFAFEATS